MRTAFREAFAEYEHPYAYLQMLLGNDALTRSELYKLFVKIDLPNPEQGRVRGVRGRRGRSSGYFRKSRMRRTTTSS